MSYESVNVFGRSSFAHRATCSPKLQSVLDLAIRQSAVDFACVCGRRGETAQTKAYSCGNSKTPWPKSEHNCTLDDCITEDPDGLSNAFDVAPYVDGIPWDDEGAFYMLAGVILSAAKQLGVKLIYGGDWDRDGLTEDQRFRDLGHFQGVDLY